MGGPFTPFDPDECTALEREIGLSLPPAYRSFLEAAGGKRLGYSVRLPACEAEPVQSFDNLFQLGRDDAGEYGWGTLLGEYQHSRDGWLAQNLPLTGLLPIARNGGSDVLFLDLNPATHGRLHAFVHAINWPGYVSNHVFTTVADDFHAYLDSLYIDPDTAEDAWADVAKSDPSDPWRRAVEEWLDKELPTWRAAAWAAPST
ncbi:SMI1/KNR4 family protein [Streptomyces sp. NPDC057249]|uniref:SMI1/KNR4 family protein n=1 Tax=Streptomyces sp. NPDC057249 TaxID=3346067 RepID=UPI0036330D53